MLADAGTVITTIGGAKQARRQRSGTGAVGDHPVRGGRSAFDRRDGNTMPSRPEAQQSHRRGSGRLLDALGRRRSMVSSGCPATRSLTRGVRRVAERINAGTAVLHLGGVQFPITGPVRYSIRARMPSNCARCFDPTPRYRSTTRDGSTPPRRVEIKQDFGNASAQVRDSLRWLSMGTVATLTV